MFEPGLTVDEMIEELRILSEQGHGDLPVVTQYNYGDHWRTTVAPTADGVELAHVDWSGYHSMPRLLEDESEGSGEVTQVVTIC